MYPPPPPPPPQAPSATSTMTPTLGTTRPEPYGAVQRRSGVDPSLTATGTAAAAAPTAASYYGSSGGYSYMGAATTAPAPPASSPYSSGTSPSRPIAPMMVSSSPSSGNRPSPSNASAGYPHARLTLAWVLLPLSLLLWSRNELLLQVFLFCSLTLYALDLANARGMVFSGLWLSWTVLTLTDAWCLWEDEATSLATFCLKTGVDSLLFLCLTCWCTLQLEWWVRDMPALYHSTTSALHFLIPVVSASILTDFYTATATHWGRVDRAATVAPHLWALMLVVGMYAVGSCTTPTAGGNTAEEQQKAILSSRQGIWHSALLLIVPPLSHLATFRRRIVSSYASYDEVYDLLLAWTVPYLFLYGLHVLLKQRAAPSHTSPYKSQWLLGQQWSSSNSTTLRGTLIPMLVSLVASLALQQAHLISFCQSIAYHFNGNEIHSGYVTSIFLTLGTLCCLLASWVWGRVSAETGEALFGEFHEDAIQLSLGATGLFFGKALGMAWTTTPLPILAFLGLSMWISTRMLRYLAIFLFVVNSSGLVIFSYRFAGIHSTIAMAIPGVQVGLIRFGMLVTSASCMVGLVAGMAVRSRGGPGTELLKKFDVTGLLLIAYVLLLLALEATLLKAPIPFRDLMGIESHDSDEDMEEMIYDPLIALMTSTVLLGVTWFMQRFKIISFKSAVVVLSVNLGKAIAVFVDMNEVELDPAASALEEIEKKASVMLFIRALAASAVILVMLAPRAFLEPVHVKSGGGVRYKRALGPSGKPATNIPASADRSIAVYALLILPATLVASIPLVLKPLVGVISGHYSGAYYISSPVPSELIGFALSLWGIASLAMVNHCLPDAGGESWKKLAAMTFLVGVGVAITAPTLPGRGVESIVKSNPYAMISSTGSRLVSTGRTRIGGWGLLSASLGTLLAITGPLELRERRDSSGQKDTLLLFRLMVFSLMFGCGVSWFITLEFMCEEAFLAIFVTATACMAISFFGTVVGVLGHFLELQNFDEAVQVAKVWAGAFPVFGILAGTTQFVRGAAHPFGMGGWLSTFLTMCSFVTFGISLVVRSRAHKNAETRALGNLSCVVSWLCSVVVCYGRYGVAGLDVSFEMVSLFGLSASVVGTFITSLILLCLEGEQATSERRKIQRVSTSSRRGSSSTFGLNFTSLSNANRLAPPIAAAVVVLLSASVYTIFIRGCGLFTAPTSPGDVLAGVQGKSETVSEDLVSIVKENILHSQAIATSAKLAGSGFWTADNMLGPLIHLGGLVATLPSLYLLVTHMWAGERISTSKIILTTPLNVIPLILCKGIPTLQAVSVVGLVGGIIQFFQAKQSDRQSKMRI